MKSDPITVRREKQLGMPYGTACSRLRKTILFSVLQESGKLTCFRCGKQILTERELSIDHKEWWENNNPDLFWNMENITFSHLRCNIQHQRHPRTKAEISDHRKCSLCQEVYPVCCFHKHKGKTGGVAADCIACNHVRKNRKQNTTYVRLVDKIHSLLELELESQYKVF